MHNTAHGTVATTTPCSSWLLWCSRILCQSRLSDQGGRVHTSRGRLGCPFCFPPAVVWRGTSDQNCSATSPSASCCNRALYQPRPCNAVPCLVSHCRTQLLKVALQSPCRAAVNQLGQCVRTSLHRRQPSAAPEHRQMPRQSRPVGHLVLAVALLLTPQPRLVRRRFALLVAAAVLVPACLLAAMCLDADLLHVLRVCLSVGCRDQMTSPARETLAMSQGAKVATNTPMIQYIILTSAVGNPFTAMLYLSQHVVPDLPEVLHVCITSGPRCLCCRHSAIVACGVLQDWCCLQACSRMVAIASWRSTASWTSQHLA